MYQNVFKSGHFKRCSLKSLMLSSASMENSMPECGRGHKTTPASSILCLPQIRMKADIQCCKIVFHALGPGCSSASFWYFPSGRRLPHFLTVNLSDDSNVTSWPIKYNWFKRVMSPKKLAWNRTCWCKLQLFFKFSTFFSNMIQSSLCEICNFQQQKIFLIL